MKHIEGQSFIARISVDTPGVQGSLKYTRAWGVAQSGWLMRHADTQSSLCLRFDYIEHTADRVHYRVSGAAGSGEYEGAKVGISLNGFLGFYHVAAVNDFWKVQVLADWVPGQDLRFIWRDQEGHRVSMSREFVPMKTKPVGNAPATRVAELLCVNRASATPLQFLATRVQLL